MASTLSYGFQKPQTGDRGSVFWPILEADIQQLNDHTHNGTNSSRLNKASISSVLDTATSGSWGNAVGGLYRQTITLPLAITAAGGTFDDYVPTFRDQATDRQLFLQTQKVSSSTYYVYCNDNTIDLDILY